MKSKTEGLPKRPHVKPAGEAGTGQPKSDKGRVLCSECGNAFHGLTACVPQASPTFGTHDVAVLSKALALADHWATSTIDEENRRQYIRLAYLIRKACQ